MQNTNNDKSYSVAEPPSTVDSGSVTVQVCVVTAVTPDRIAKQLTLQDGKLHKSSGGQLAEGALRVETLHSHDDLSRLLTELTPKEALILGAPAGRPTRILSKKAYEQTGRAADAVTRTKDSFAFGSYPGLVMLDYDVQRGETPLSADEVHSQIVKAMPELADVRMLCYPSSSSCIYETGTSEALAGVGGLHFYFFIDDASRTPELGQVLFDRLWLAGHGHIEISKDGKALMRSTIDKAVFSPERLDFAGGAEVGSGLEQRRGDPVEVGGAQAVFKAAALLPLADDEQRRVVELQATARDALRGALDAKRDAYVADAAPKLAKDRKIPVEQARTIVRAATDGRLDLGWPLVREDGLKLTVEKLLAHPDAHDGMYFRDPIEPQDDDTQVCWFDRARRKLFNHKRGGTWYALGAVKPVVELRNGEMAAAVEQVAAHLKASGCVFQRGGQVVFLEADGGLHSYRADGMRQKIEGIVSFVKWQKRAGRPSADGSGNELVTVSSDCPADIANRLTQLVSSSGLQEVVATVDHPIITPSGGLLDQPGYSAAEKILLVNARGHWPTVPVAPTDEEVAAAFQVVFRPFETFPFADTESRSAFIASVLSVILRPGLDTAPFIMIEAATAGTGKTLLARALGEIAGGAQIQAPPTSFEEMGKVLTMLLNTDTRYILMDNMEGVIGGVALDAVATSEFYNARRLGTSDSQGQNLSTRKSFVFTVNNGRLHGDSNRRTSRIYLNAQVEDVLGRTFNRDPVQLVRQRRNEIIVAGLTIVQAWLHSPEAKAMGGLSGSFQGWQRLCAAPTGWLGSVLRRVFGDNAPELINPAGLLAVQAMAGDDARETFGDALQAWWAWQQDNSGVTGIKALDLWRLISDGWGRPGSGLAGELAYTLGNALGDVKTARQFGQHLGRKKGVRIRDLMLTQVWEEGSRPGKDAPLWMVQQAS